MHVSVQPEPRNQLRRHHHHASLRLWVLSVFCNVDLALSVLPDAGSNPKTGVFLPRARLASLNLLYNDSTTSPFPSTTRSCSRVPSTCPLLAAVQIGRLVPHEGIATLVAAAV